METSSEQKTMSLFILALDVNLWMNRNEILSRTK